MANEIMDLSFYNKIKEILSSARAKVYSAANFAMVEAYWEIGKSIVEKQGGNATAEYGTSLLKELSKQMTANFGKGFTVTNLSYMRQFYLTFPNRHALRDKLSWTHYRMIMKVEDVKAREFYVDECAKANWSKNDSVVGYTLSEDHKQIFTSKYMLYLPTEEELQKEINAERNALYPQRRA